MTMRLTKRVVDAAEAGERDVFLWDSDMRGFGLKVTPGGIKSYVVQYRVGSGRRAPKRRMVIGKHGSPWTPETARTEASRILGLVAGGKDPSEQRAAERAAMSMAELCDLYLAEGVSHKKASTIKADRGRVTLHLKPLIGQKRVDTLRRADIERLYMDVKAGKTAAAKPKAGERGRGSIASGGVGVAGQCVTLACTILAFAVERGLRPDNPALGIKKAPVRKMERFLSQQEIARLAEALAAEATNSGNPYPAAAIRLLLLTGCRRGEILGLKWAHVDLEPGRECLRLPDSKTGAKVVHLNAPALDVLANLPRVKGNPHVIVGHVAKSPLTGIDKVWFRVRKAAGLDGVRLHDLRHSYAAVGAAGGLGLPLIGALLGHRHTMTTARYAHLSDDPVRAASELIGARLSAAMGSSAPAAKPSADVVKLAPGGKRPRRRQGMGV